MPDTPPPPTWLAPLVAGVAALAAGVWGVALRRRLGGRPLLRRRARRPAPWQAEGPALAAVMTFAALGALASDASPTPELDAAAALRIGLTYALFAASAAAFGALGSGGRWRDFGLPRTWREGARDVGVGVAASAAMLPIVYGVQWVIVYGLGAPSAHPTVERLLEGADAEAIFAAAFLAAVVAPLFEELAYRVMLQGWLEARAERGAWWPVGVSSLAFALAHTGQGWAPVPLFVFALGVGYVYRQTHRYAPVVAMHMAFNAVGLAIAIAAARAATGEGP